MRVYLEKIAYHVVLVFRYLCSCFISDKIRNE